LFAGERFRIVDSVTRLLLTLLLFVPLGTGCPIVLTCEDVPCPYGEVCNVSTGECEEVAEDCRLDDICRPGEVCDEETGQCRPEKLRCTERFVCPEGQSCNATSGFCEPAFRCETDADCGPAETCDLATQECEPRTCEPDRDDCPIAFVCGGDGQCISGCHPEDEAACHDGQFCQVLSGEMLGRCVPNCREDADCPFGQFCDLTAPPETECVREGPCSVDADCREDEVCNAGVCGQPPCRSDGDCLLSQICEVATGTCRTGECTEDIYGQQPANHSFESAFGLDPGNYTELTLCAGRSDWFAVNARGTDVVRFRLRQRTPTPDIDLHVYDEHGALIGSNQLLAAVSSVKLAAGRDQTLFVEIRSEEFESATYDLAISTEFCPNDSFEENDSADEATVVPSNVGIPAELDLLACGFDEDWFRISQPNATNGIAITQKESTPDLRVELYTPDGSRFEVGRDVPYQELRSGTVGDYLVRAVGSLGQTGGYLLGFEVLEPWACPEAGEHDSLADARPVPVGAPGRETFCPVDGAWEIDWLGLEVPQTGLLHAEVVPNANMPDVEVALVANEGGTQRLVRTAIELDNRHVIEAAIDPSMELYLRVSASSPVGRILDEPAYEVSYSVD
jgi:hypothetical protein